MGYALIRPRRGTEEDWSIVNPQLAEGELIMVCPDSGVGTGFTKFKIGDGLHRFLELPYAFDGTAAHFTGGSISAFNVLSLRAGTKEEWEDIDPVLDQFELVYDSTERLFKVGDGSSRFTELEYIGDNFDGDYGDEDAS